VPNISDVVPFLEKAMEIAKKNEADVMVEAIPPCFLPAIEKNMAEIFTPSVYLIDVDERVLDFNKMQKDGGKAKGPQCRICKYDGICEGLRKEYAEKKGFGELVPVA
jgi:PP-loop superfamily ATP-utilizing enzyme